MQSTGVRVDRRTHQEIRNLSLEMGVSVGETVALAVRGLLQSRQGRELRASLHDDERA
ncbi:MAG: hypothetical protein ACFCVG_11340 [Kineosporiaceae bacterium]